MSLKEKRDEVVTALNTVEGVRAFAYKPNPLQPGVAWVVQEALIIDPQSGQYEDNFSVIVFLHQADDKAAFEWMSDHWEEIVNALNGMDNDVAYVDRVEPVSLGSGDTAQYAMQISMRSE